EWSGDSDQRNQGLGRLKDKRPTCITVTSQGKRQQGVPQCSYMRPGVEYIKLARRSGGFATTHCKIQKNSSVIKKRLTDAGEIYEGTQFTVKIKLDEGKTVSKLNSLTINYKSSGVEKNLLDDEVERDLLKEINRNIDYYVNRNGYKLVIPLKNTIHIDDNIEDKSVWLKFHDKLQELIKEFIDNLEKAEKGEERETLLDQGAIMIEVGYEYTDKSE
ncbi:MAG: hypothetical protein OXC40_00145, partial [Proteobacteria bacterium]|nr:hypothetical protein [Pseudomonadota bacterium]